MLKETCVTRAWRLHQTELLRFLQGRMRNSAAAADLLQDVFLKALRQERKFCALDDPRAWLFAVARNVLIDHVRTQHVQVELPDDLAFSEHELPPVDNLAECLPLVLDRMQPDDRDILEHCELGGMTQRDYAASRGLTLPAVKSRVLRARVRMRDMLTSVCGVRFDQETGAVCCRVGTVADAGKASMRRLPVAPRD